MNSPLENKAQAVLFISFGGPEKSEDIMPFLEIVTKGRGIPRARLENVAHHYEAIGGKSPINEITRRQASLLEEHLDAGPGTRDERLKVYIGQRNWHPFIEHTLRTMAADGVKRAIGFITAAHRCEASLERYVEAVASARRNIGASAPIIDYVNPWFDHPLFIEAICERIKETLAPMPRRPDAPTPPYVFTAHSIPCAMAKDSPYVSDLRRSAQLVCEKMGQKNWRLAYSSRSGRPEDPWLVPDVCDLIREAARETKNIILIPIGFVADHVEVLFDLDVEARQAAREAGITLFRAQTVGDHPLFARMMADVVRRRINSKEAPEQRSSKVPPTAGCFCFPDSSGPPCKS